LQQHLLTHEEGRNWVELFKKNKECIKSDHKKLDEKSLALVKFFIESNIAMEALSNKHLRSILPVKFTPGKYSFRNVFIPEMMSHLSNAITEKLMGAIYINLITDIWTNINTVDFLGLAAVCVYNNFKKEIFTIGLTPMIGSHCAENIKKAIEFIVNKHEFHKSKIVSVVCDEGSNLLRLFKANGDYLLPAKKKKALAIDYQTALNGADMDEDEDDEDYQPESEDDESEDDEEIDDSDDDHDNESDDDPEVIETEKELRSDDFFSKKIQTSKRQAQSNAEKQVAVEDFLSEYNLNKGSLVTEQNLEIGSNKVARYNCAAHKMNLVIRKAIKRNPHLSKLLISLSKLKTNVKKSIHKSKLHRNKRANLVKQNFTRWSSSFMMLFSYYKAYHRGVFTNEHECPVSKDEIGDYLQILLPFTSKSCKYFDYNTISSNSYSC
jgi:hypothetical protein